MLRGFSNHCFNTEYGGTKAYVCSACTSPFSSSICEVVLMAVTNIVELHMESDEYIFFFLRNRGSEK